jgi:hypothetical protein
MKVLTNGVRQRMRMDRESTVVPVLLPSGMIRERELLPHRLRLRARRRTTPSSGRK